MNENEQWSPYQPAVTCRRCDDQGWYPAAAPTAIADIVSPADDHSWVEVYCSCPRGVLLRESDAVATLSRTCSVCAQPVSTGDPLCESCAVGVLDMLIADAPICSECAQPISAHAGAGDRLCERCALDLRAPMRGVSMRCQWCGVLAGDALKVVVTCKKSPFGKRHVWRLL